MKLNRTFFIMTLIFWFFSLVGSAQDFALPSPEGWVNESFPFPIDFAKDIPYSGEEVVRFTPGWGNAKSEEYWSYSFLWWINEDAKVDEALLSTYLTSYYAGLVGRNVISRKIEQSKIVPTLAKIKNAKGTYVYEGTVSMLDYMEQKPMAMNIRIHDAVCEKARRRAIFVEVSPQPIAHSVWKDFETIWQGFKCK